MTGRPRRREPDETDRALLAALRQDGRTSNVDLARRLGISEKTVRLRIARLREEHGLVVTAELSGAPRASRLMCMLRTEPARRITVADSLRARAGVEQVYLASGAADVIVIAGFPDDSAALRFLVEVVEADPHVTSVQSCHLIDDAPATAMTGRVPHVDQDALAALTIASAPRQTCEEVLAAVCDAAVDGLGADRVVVARGGAPTTTDDGAPDQATMTAAAKRGVTDEYLSRMSARLDNEVHGVIRLVWETRMHVAVQDATTDPVMTGLHDLVREAGYTALLALPMLYGQSLLATVCLYYDSATSLTGDYIATAQQIVDFFAVTYSRAAGLEHPHSASTLH